MITDTIPTRVDKDLALAADIIEAHGWVQGHFGNKEVGYCVIGGITMATLDYSDNIRTQEALAKRLGISFGELDGWNDAPERTKDEVLAALRGGYKW